MVSAVVLVVEEIISLSLVIVELLTSYFTTFWTVDDYLIILTSFVVCVWVPVTESTENCVVLGDSVIRVGFLVSGAL